MSLSSKNGTMLPEGSDPAVENDWSFLPFMALSDGAHAATEDFSYFTLRKKATPDQSATSLFGMSCTRQLDARELINKPDDVTRSTVQKSVVVVAKSPHVFTAWREKLSLVTRAWFLQREFTNVTILREFQENLAESERNTTEEQRDHFVGVSLREFVHEFKHQALVLFKCCLLQPKMLFFGSRCERLCMVQFALVSLIPGLIRKLGDCADPELDSYEKTATRPTSLKTSDRKSLLAYVGLPVQIFGKGSLFGPYTPLQQLDVLADYGTKSYVVGSTNSLLLQQKDRYSDIIINLDDSTVSITSSSLRQALGLTAADRRWIDIIHQEVVNSWDPLNPSRPKDLGFKGSEDYIRILFEQYIIALLSATRYHLYLTRHPHPQPLPDVEGDPLLDFGEHWLDAWRATPSFALWDRLTADADANLFDFVDPRHPTAGGFSVDDFNRRLAAQFAELQLDFDGRFANGREALGKHLASGQKRVSAALSSVWAEVEARRKAAAAARARAAAEEGIEDSRANSQGQNREANGKSNWQGYGDGAGSGQSSFLETARARAPDLSGASAVASAAGQKAGAYFSSWGSWAAEKKRGWGAGVISSSSSVAAAKSPSTATLPSMNTTLGMTPAEKVAVQEALGRPASVPAGSGAGLASVPERDGEGGTMNEKRAAAARLVFGGDVAEREKEKEKRKSVGSPRKSVRRGISRESVGSDGIGRLDA